MNCKDCVFWAKTCYFRDGECRHRAPLVRTSEDPNYGSVNHHRNLIWPHTDEDDWCGDFKALKPEDPKDNGVL